MTLSMAACAERYQILDHVSAKATSRHHVMNVQVLQGTAVLASPTVSFQDLFTKDAIFFRFQFESRLPMAQVHRIRSSTARVLPA